MRISKAIACLLLACCTATPAADRPNIVIIMSDDSGYSDLSCFGGEIPTPRIDRLAAKGLRLTNFHTNARCSPTRASLMTGLYPHQVGVGDLCRPYDETPYPGYLGYMSRTGATIAELLRAAGYHTLMSGKWHLGGERTQPEQRNEELAKWPMGRGFDRFFGLIHGQSGYQVPTPGRPYRLGNEDYPVREGDGFYATTAFTDFALRFIDEARAKDARPIFLYLAYTAPHDPLEAPEADIARHRATYATSKKLDALQTSRVERLKSAGIVPAQWKPRRKAKSIGGEKNLEKLATYAAMVELMDKEVGRVVDKFRDMGELDNTFLMFFSDNGATGAASRLANTPFLGSKGNLWQGGTITHSVAHWPGQIANEGGLSNELSHVIDIMPTCLEVAGVPYPATFDGRDLPPLAGRSLVPVLRGQKRKGHEALYWDLYGYQAVIHGKWKYLSDQQNREYLFDLEADGTEYDNLAERFPDRLVELREAHAVWAKRNNVLPWDVVKKAQSKWKKKER